MEQAEVSVIYKIVSSYILPYMNVYLQVDHWLEFSAQRLCGNPGLAVALAELDKALSLRTFLVGHALTLADISVWASLKGAFCYLFWLSCVSFSTYSSTKTMLVFFVLVQLQFMRSGKARASPSPMSVAGSSS